MFSLSFLFLTLPLYFSHVFMHFDVVIGDSASFERQKMYLFILTVLIVFAEMILTRYEGLISQMKRHGLVMLGLISLPLIPVFLYGGDIDIYWIRGSYEKFHGYLLYIGIIILGFCISLLKMHEKRRLVTLSMIPATLVSIIALLEGIGVQVFSPPNIGTWGEGVRAIATLGNPNYLAGYLLILLPLTGYIRTPERYILGFLIFTALLVTWSYIGIAIMGIYGVYLLLDWGFSFLSFRSKTEESLVFPLMRKKESTSLKMNLKGIPTGGQKKHWFLFLSTLIITALFALVGYFLIPTDKLLSLSGRFVLMWEIIREVVRWPMSILTGYGPEAVLRFFAETRSITVDSYFPRVSIIDSSHNIFLDFIFQYGIMPLIFLIMVVYKNWNTWNPHARASWVLGITFLMFNPYVVMHLALLTLTLSFSLHDNRR